MGHLVTKHRGEQVVILDEVDQARVDKYLLCREGQRIDLRLQGS